MACMVNYCYCTLQGVKHVKSDDIDCEGWQHRESLPMNQGISWKYDIITVKIFGEAIGRTTDIQSHQEPFLRDGLDNFPRRFFRDSAELPTQSEIPRNPVIKSKTGKKVDLGTTLPLSRTNVKSCYSRFHVINFPAGGSTPTQGPPKDVSPAPPNQELEIGLLNIFILNLPLNTYSVVPAPIRTPTKFDNPQQRTNGIYEVAVHLHFFNHTMPEAFPGPRNVYGLGHDMVDAQLDPPAIERVPLFTPLPLSLAATATS
ncbi:hypothetical protein EDB87DRAFT_1578284 [Lactarius vividus]|nr:hypothetical protein EDB87DRAFT_1578284 [Lactarius vividus]